IVQRLLQAKRFHGDARTADGKSWTEHAGAATERPGQDVVRPQGKPLRATGGLVILRGNLAPDGCVLKMAGHERTFHRGPAGVFAKYVALVSSAAEGAVTQLPPVSTSSASSSPTQAEAKEVNDGHHLHR